MEVCLLYNLKSNINDVYLFICRFSLVELIITNEMTNITDVQTAMDLGATTSGKKLQF